MKYVGILRQQSSNNFKSLLLLIMFPALLLGLTWVFCAVMLRNSGYYDDAGNYFAYNITTGEAFAGIAPIVLAATAIWFLVAYMFNSSMISNATSSKPLERRENKRVYNLVENLCMAQGMTMPKVNVIEDSSLNAFASGINNKSYTVTLSRGIIERLNDDELEGVIAHELCHIRNRDVRLLVISIIFVGIFTYIAQIAFRSLLYAPRRDSGGKNGGGAIALILAMVLAAIGYFFSLLLRFAISRKREYMADAGAAEMTRKPWALASALRKISGDPRIESVTRDDVAQLFIEHPLSKKGGFSSLFATHPPIQERIKVLEQF
jgi:heat shock protein HtpX